MSELNEEGLEFMDIREDYQPASPTVSIPSTSPFQQPRPQQFSTLTLGDFEQRLMQTISRLEAEEAQEQASSAVHVITAALNDSQYSQLPSSPQHTSATSPTPLLTPSTDSSSPFPTKHMPLKSSLTASSISLNTLNHQALKHSHSASSLYTLTAQKSVSFSQNLNVETFSKYSSPNTPTNKSVESLQKSPLPRKQRKPFILNAQGVSSDTDTDSQYSDDSDGDFLFNDHTPLAHPHKSAVASLVVERDTVPPTDEAMEDLLTINQLQCEFYEKRDAFKLHNMVDRSVDEQWTSEFEADEVREYEGMTFKPQDMHLRYPAGEIDADIMDYVMSQSIPIPAVDVPQVSSAKTQPHDRKPMSKFMAMRQAQNQVIEMS